MTRLIHASACHLDKEVLFGGVGGEFARKEKLGLRCWLKCWRHTWKQCCVAWFGVCVVLFGVCVDLFGDFGGFVAVLLLFLVGCCTKLIHKF